MYKHIFAVEPVSKHKLKPPVLVHVLDVGEQNAGPQSRGVDKLLEPQVVSEGEVGRGKPAVILPGEVEIAHRIHQVCTYIGLGSPYKTVYVVVILKVEYEVVVLILIGISAEGHIMHNVREVGDCEGDVGDTPSYSLCQSRGAAFD